jgi:hypothetical protein
MPVLVGEEAHDWLDFLGPRSQEELLPPELHSAQARQSDLILQFREQGLHLLLSSPGVASGMSAFGSVSEHNSECYSSGRSSNQTEKGEARD